MSEIKKKSGALLSSNQKSSKSQRSGFVHNCKSN